MKPEERGGALAHTPMDGEEAARPFFLCTGATETADDTSSGDGRGRHCALLIPSTMEMADDTLSGDDRGRHDALPVPDATEEADGASNGGGG